MSETTQRERLIAAIKAVVPSAGCYDALEKVLGEAQNRPPHGMADGTISEAEWYAARDLAYACAAFVEKIDAARDVFKKQNGCKHATRPM